MPYIPIHKVEKHKPTCPLGNKLPIHISDIVIGNWDFVFTLCHIHIFSST